MFEPRAIPERIKEGQSPLGVRSESSCRDDVSAVLSAVALAKAEALAKEEASAEAEALEESGRSDR
jgi:hypothetical protein